MKKFNDRERERETEREGGGEGAREKYSVNMLCLSLSYYICFINLLIFYIGIFIINFVFLHQSPNFITSSLY